MRNINLLPKKKKKKKKEPYKRGLGITGTSAPHIKDGKTFYLLLLSCPPRDQLR